MRTKDYRLVVWKDRRFQDSAPISQELYDYRDDPYETTNLADENPTLVEKLLGTFNTEW